MLRYLDLLTDPFSDTRGGFNGPAGQPMGYAQQQSQRQPLPADAASAYAKVLKAPAAPPPETRKWDVWAAGFGGYNRTDGDAVTVGSSNLTSRAYGYAAGFDYRFTPDSAIGFSLAGGLTNWGLASALGGGSSDVFQAGVYGWKRWNNFYVSGAIAGAIHDVDTNRTVTVAGVDTLRGNTDAQNIAGRLELGYRLIAPIVDFTPYGAAQVQHYRLNGYTETAAFGSNQFALSYAEQSSTMTRTELGARLDKRYAVMGDSVLNLFGRAAWVHDWNRDSALTPTFATLPLTTFTVTGANPDEDLALVTAGAELITRSRWALMAKFAGEFGGNTQTYTGTGRIRYTW